MTVDAAEMLTDVVARERLIRTQAAKIDALQEDRERLLDEIHELTSDLRGSRGLIASAIRLYRRLVG